jgi:hypothetical protein
MVKSTIKTEKAIAELISLKQKLAERLAVAGNASREVMNISIQLETSRKNLPK